MKSRWQELATFLGYALFWSLGLRWRRGRMAVASDVSILKAADSRARTLESLWKGNVKDFTHTRAQLINFLRDAQRGRKDPIAYKPEDLANRLGCSILELEKIMSFKDEFEIVVDRKFPEISSRAADQFWGTGTLAPAAIELRVR